MQILATSALFSIDNPDNLAQITTDLNSYFIGDDVTVTVTNGPGDAANTVAIYSESGDPATIVPLDWVYLSSNSKQLPATGNANGIVSFSTVGWAQTFKVARLLSDVPPVLTPPPDPLFEETWEGSDTAAWNATRWPTIDPTSTSIVDIQGNQGRMIPQGAAYALARAASASGSLSDFDLTVKFTRATAGEQYHKVLVRHDGSFTNDDPTNGYMFSIDSWDETNRFFVFLPVTDGVRGTPISLAKSWTQDQWIMRIQCEGTALRAKAWAAAGSEPGSWDINTTDSDHASGVIGLVAVNGNATTARQILWDDLLVNPLV